MCSTLQLINDGGEYKNKYFYLELEFNEPIDGEGVTSLGKKEQSFSVINVPHKSVGKNPGADSGGPAWGSGAGFSNWPMMPTLLCESHRHLAIQVAR